MENQDQYIVYLIKGASFYYKNNKLHREEGPAYVPEQSKSLYRNLSDHNLYKRVTIHDLKESDVVYPIYNKLFNGFYLSNTPLFFLEGIQYEKSDFKVKAEKFKLNRELQKKMPIHESTSKKMKI